MGLNCPKNRESGKGKKGFSKGDRFEKGKSKGKSSEEEFSHVGSLLLQPFGRGDDVLETDRLEDVSLTPLWL